ncbi:23S rRNA (pseudouridine(1915)-N(3))-methyltransferase RlmH [Kaustia mangrovi]|uniref:Ribosomal RNA large subunit methyltransferase H n=1 Tax=Kaustia mangrovi TaxID=2593653 RepID=A0A7S8C597_9HYPH|nr:23S rRNA (pseudouridine(1915)-N(3))-methyltransferase RlmH [Kaustia mangrovi]QPC43646.1 23S rRNA (pseudouridine(1915)-N(3))-methyltransferase RlmH [Kaustia mangrovi]
MRVSVNAVGRLKRGPERELCERYVERAAAQGRTVGVSAVTMSDIAESQAATVELRRADEAARLAAMVPDRAVTVALDETGRELASTAFAARLRGWLEDGTPDLCFLIGGPDGHGGEIRESAGLVLSLGRMTWPHGLARAMLCEQIYRAVTILVNHPYHRS